MKIRVYRVRTDNGWGLAIEDQSDLNTPLEQVSPLSTVRFNYAEDEPKGSVMCGMWNDEYSDSVQEFEFLGEVELPTGGGESKQDHPEASCQ